jgi:type IV fimbrial biogenesis protein FimT
LNTGRYSHTGYTLVELMITLVIGAVLLVLVVPSYKPSVLNSRMSAATTDLLGNLMSARAESVARNNFVTVCKSDDGEDCTVAGNWAQGWITFVDNDADGTVDAGDGDEIVQIHAALPNHAEPNGPTARGTTGIESLITYNPNGMTSLTQTETLVLCDERGFGDADDAFARAIVISMLGKGSAMDAADSSQTTCLVDP